MPIGKAPYKHLTAILILAFTAFFASCSANEPPDASEQIAKASAYILTIDENEVAFIESSVTAENIVSLLTTIKTDEIKKSGKSPVSVSVNSKVEITQTFCDENEIKSPETAIEDYKNSGGMISYTVTLSESVTEAIPFDTVYKNSSAYYEGEKITSVSGKNGEKLLTYNVTYKNESESSRVLVSEKELSPATDKVILIGTKKSTASTGKYLFPLKNMYVTSSYGGRYLNSEYDFHLGVDLRAAKGTNVYASDGGEVIYSGYMGSYGYLIKIRHDNGDVTYYAHLSSLGVKKGVRVYQGQCIAKSGATGNVTGAHLHFEIRRNGKTVNPLTLLPNF